MAATGSRESLDAGTVYNGGEFAPALVGDEETASNGLRPVQAPLVDAATNQPRTQRPPPRERSNANRDSINPRMQEAHELFERIWDLPNILPNEDARRCVAHYGELWCLHQGHISLELWH